MTSFLLARLRGRCVEQAAKGLLRDYISFPGAQGVVRCLPSGEQVVSFASNDYLGLAAHPLMRRAVSEAVMREGVGAGASQTVVGGMQVHRDAELAFAAYFGFADALLFPSGYMANLAALTTVLTQQDVVYHDKQNHASLIDAVQLSGAKRCRYAHGDLAHLARRLSSGVAKGQLLVTDGVFSISGDVADVPGILALTAAAGVDCYLDDSHGAGVLGHGGRGILSHYGIAADRVLGYLCGLGKAFGLSGAMLMGSVDFIAGVRQFARSYIYTTAVMPLLAVGASCALQLLQDEPYRLDRLRERIAYFQAGLLSRGLLGVASVSAIQSIECDSSAEALQLSQLLQQRGFLLYAMRPPTTQQPCLRVTLSAEHTPKQIDDLLDALLQAMTVVGRR